MSGSRCNVACTIHAVSATPQVPVPTELQSRPELTEQVPGEVDNMRLYLRSLRLVRSVNVSTFNRSFKWSQFECLPAFNAYLTGLACLNGHPKSSQTTSVPTCRSHAGSSRLRASQSIWRQVSYARACDVHLPKQLDVCNTRCHAKPPRT